MKRIKLIIMMSLAILVLAACSKSTGDDEEKSVNTPTGEVTVTETVTPTEEVTPTDTPAPTEEITPTDTTVPTAEITPTEEPAPTEIPVDPNLPKLPNGKTLSIDTLPLVDGALALEPYYDAVFAELLGLPVEDAKLFLMCNNTPSAYRNLTYGQADMIFCALPSDAQVEEAEKAGVEFEYHTILSGGFVFFVNKDNPVDSITQEQLKGIVSGKITNWKEVGGEDEPIVLYQRNEGSGSQTGLYRYVLPKEEVRGPAVKTELPLQGAQVRFLVGELGSCLPHSKTKNKQKWASSLTQCAH